MSLNSPGGQIGFQATLCEIDRFSCRHQKMSTDRESCQIDDPEDEEVSDAV
jgi:hypothetical protein